VSKLNFHVTTILHSKTNLCFSIAMFNIRLQFNLFITFLNNLQGTKRQLFASIHLIIIYKD